MEKTVISVEEILKDRGLVDKSHHTNSTERQQMISQFEKMLIFNLQQKTTTIIMSKYILQHTLRNHGIVSLFLSSIANLP